MGKIVKQNVELSNITRVDLMCSRESSENINNLLKRNVNIHKGKNKLLTQSYLFLSYLTNSYDKDIKLDGIRIWTIDGEVYIISTYDIIDNQITINDNAVKLILNALNYVSLQGQANINILDYNNLDYVPSDIGNKRGK